MLRALVNSYTSLPKFVALGPPDVILRLADACDFPVHAEVLKACSGVLRDVARGTLGQVNACDDSEGMAMSIIPLSDGDALCWNQSLTALYCMLDGLADETWRTILVRCVDKG